jgi:hypothetical protein
MKKQHNRRAIKPALLLAAQTILCGLLGFAFVAAAVLLRELTR